MADSICLTNNSLLALVDYDMPLKDIRCCKGAESKQPNVVSEETLHCRGVIVDQ